MLFRSSQIEEFHIEAGQPQASRSSLQRWTRPGNSSAPVWLRPNANCHLAARVTAGLLRADRGPIGYLSLGEPAVHALARVLFVMARVDASKVPAGELAEMDFPRITAAAGKLAGSPLVFSDRDVPARRIPETTRRFIQEAQLDCLVVDDPDVPTLRRPEVLEEQERWRIRMEFREAVRGTAVELYLPG